MHVEFDFEHFEPTEYDIEAIKGILGMNPQINTENPPERYEIIGDVVETENIIDPAEKKQENDHDKKDEKPNITIN